MRFASTLGLLRAPLVSEKHELLRKWVEDTAEGGWTKGPESESSKSWGSL